MDAQRRDRERNCQQTQEVLRKEEACIYFLHFPLTWRACRLHGQRYSEVCVSERESYLTQCQLGFFLG
jgi:hypothetical protein